MILSENEQKIEKFCQDIRYQIGLLDSHMVTLASGKKPLITDKQYNESLKTMLDKIAEIEAELPEDFQKEKTLNDKLIEVQNRIGDIKFIIGRIMESIDAEAEKYDEEVHKAINEVTDD